MAGNPGRAETYFKALMSEPETAFVGTQGLLTQAIEADDEDRALKLALHAKELKPKDEGTLETLYTLQSRKFDWTAARATLTDQRKAGHVGKLEAAKRESALALAQAEDADSLGEEEHARALAVEAAKLDPTNVDAVATAVRHLVASGSRRAASKLVTDGWRARPHPVLAAAYASIEPDESPSERRRRFEALFNLQPTHDETRFLRAELALVAEDWKAARNSLQDLRETEPSARSCAIMAAIAKGEGEPDHVIRGWLARAIGAPRKDATDSEISHAAMLPLIVETVGEGEADDAGVGPGSEPPETEQENSQDVFEAEVQDEDSTGVANGSKPKSEAAA
jgi:HemY protein